MRILLLTVLAGLVCTAGALATGGATRPPSKLTAAVVSKHSDGRTSICGGTHTVAVVPAGSRVYVSGAVWTEQPQEYWIPLHVALLRCGVPGLKGVVQGTSWGLTATGTFRGFFKVPRAGKYRISLGFNGTNGEATIKSLYVLAR